MDEAEEAVEHRSQNATWQKGMAEPRHTRLRLGLLQQ